MSNNQQEVLNSILDYFILIGELDEVREAKNKCVKNQEYQNAAEIRDKEVELLKQLPNLQQFKDLKLQLNNK